MKFNRNKWWGKHERFCRQVRVLYGRVREFSKPHVSTILGHVKVLYGRTQKCSPPFILAIPGQIKALYEKAQRSENTILDGINIFVPLFLTALIVLGCIIFVSRYDLSAGNIRNWIFLFAGVWGFYGIIVAGRRTAEFAKQVRIQEQGQVAERLAKAAEQLSSAVMSIRILAILSLEKIAIEAEDEIREDVVKVLCAYIREKYPAKRKNKILSFSDESPMQDDIKEIINVLSYVQIKKDDQIQINLPETNLSLGEFSGIIFKYANLSGANLSSINLSGTNLLGVDLLDANLSSADLGYANLSGADLSGANLSNADLGHANLSGANLSNADLGHANLLDADLSNADLSEFKGLDTAKNLETVKDPPPEILAEIERRKQHGQK